MEQMFFGSIPICLVWYQPTKRTGKVENELKRRFGKREAVVRIEAIPGDDREIKGYMAFTRP